ncbi:hypothetical protein CEE45_02780 [Candidatus Heimdallarchaeota archaeon B3_Heim]|nr:MAG: hypothetical protein CEE45_02780 [Candidatus Heimdallarchaeota archaeon B3_Heim]
MYLETLATLKGYQTQRMKENNSSISNNILKSQSTRRVTKHIPLQGQNTNPPDKERRSNAVDRKLSTKGKKKTSIGRINILRKRKNILKNNTYYNDP